MKKILLSLSLLVILGLPQAMAQVPNSGFETWTKNALATNAWDPNGGIGTTGWWDLNTFNFFLLGSTPITVYKDSLNPFQGKFCAKIVSQTMSTVSYDTMKHFDPTFNYPQTNGLMFTATVSLSGVLTGIPVTSNWQSFSFYYKYFPNGSDTCSCTVAMYHWDAVGKKRILIGGGIWKSGVGQPAWTKDSSIIRYDTTLMADTAFVIFSAASVYSNPKVNDSMMVDEAGDISAVNNVPAHHDNVNLYPNPANNQINLAVSGVYQANLVEVYDITGKLVSTYSMHNNFLNINTQSYNSGIYIYKMFDNTGAQLNVGKFSVIK